MKKDFKDIFKDIAQPLLSENERIVMRNQMQLFMSENPVSAPLSVRFADFVESFSAQFSAKESPVARFVPATLALILVVGVGTSYAAENALPGDALYAVKLNINESIKGSLAISDASQATWNTEKLSRRLEEAEALVVIDLLTPVAQAVLKAHINTTVRAFDENVLRLTEANEEALVAAVQSDLEASLIGHAEVLVALSSTPDSESALQPILASVIAKAESAQASRTSNEATIVAKRDGKKIRAAALNKKNIAVEAVITARAKAVAATKAEATTTAAAAQDSADIAAVSIGIAEQKLNDGDYGSAFSTFQEAIRAVQTAEVHIDASERLNEDVQKFSGTRTEGEASASLMSSDPTETQNQ